MAASCLSEGPQSTPSSVTQWGCATEWATGCLVLAGLEGHRQERLPESERGLRVLESPTQKEECEPEPRGQVGCLTYP